MRKPSKSSKNAKAAMATKPSKAKKSAKAKKAPKKKAAAGAALAGGVLGCCTLTGSGRDTQIEGITKIECEKRAAAAGKNPIWSPGKCAQPTGR